MLEYKLKLKKQTGLWNVIVKCVLQFAIQNQSFHIDELNAIRYADAVKDIQSLYTSVLFSLSSFVKRR